MSFWDFIVYVFWFYILFTCLIIFFTIFFDVFRDKSLGGFAKVLWVIFLIVVPFLAALIYLIARGRGMAQRKLGDAQAAQEAQASAIRAAAATPSSNLDDIAKAKTLLDAGTITQAEFDGLKAKALA